MFLLPWLLCSAAADADLFAQIHRALAGTRVRAVEMVVRLPRPNGSFERYPIFLAGEDAVDGAVKLLAESTVHRKGRAPQPADKFEEWATTRDCRLVLERDPNLVELEKRGELLLDLLEEDDGRKPPAKLSVGPLVMFDLNPDTMELILPAEASVHRLTCESAKLRAHLKAAVDVDVKKAAEIWGDSLPYGMARSSLAEGIAYRQLGYPDESRAALNRCIAICKAKNNWKYLADEAEKRLMPAKM